ncbi:Rieske 2Fe-2S domain-containing protein [Sciscionella sediminilitoris]|uniref:Rieske 2Fe-2S domain-containing protein n=1 Tax=Sciscionella sediminilitoris TaxID=1445613 RepID=UPI0004DEF2FF|nr:Rieske 2Fe-2S domain-containing protein [Sciscionella sp. SE31]
MSVRNIDTGASTARYARGWHCLGLAETFRDGQPHAIEAFGTKLVVWAGQDGKLHALDGYCRHMGADLTQGTVKGDSIACPFHDWRWGGNGKCTGIPYAKRVPLRARSRGWPTSEQNGQLFVWNDPQGNPPIAEQAIPEIPGVNTEQWSDWIWDQRVISGSNCREVIDNVADVAHFFYVHHAFPTQFSNIFSGHTATQYLRSKARPDYMKDPKKAEGSTLRSEATYFGPSYMVNWLWPALNGNEIECVLINCHYPITEDSFMLQWGLAAKGFPGMEPEHIQILAQKLHKNFGDGFLQDVEIWENKTKIDNPLLCEEDGPVYQLRRWYEQFYVDVEDISEEMTNRFEFEVDTTRANEVWEAEVAENLALRAEREKAEA